MTAKTYLPMAIALCFAAVVIPRPAQAVDLRPGWKLGIAGKAEDITTPVFFAYPDRIISGQMIVLANDKGAAAVRFIASDPLPGITLMKYEYRYESFDGKTKLNGAAELFEQRDDEDRMGGNVHIIIGDLVVGWSPGDHNCCWIYYTPEKVRVHVAKASFFASREEPLPGEPGEFRTIPALDLKRFKR